MYTVIFESVALDDVTDAKSYYRGVSNQLADCFQDELEKAIQLLTANPLIFQKRIKDSRFLQIKPFPFVIVYVVEQQTVIVDAVFHTGQEPSLLHKRV